MATKSALEQLAAAQAEYEKKIASIKEEAVGELTIKINEKRAELNELIRQKEEITGKAATRDSGTKQKRTRLAPLVKDSDEYAELVKGAKTALSKHPTGLNGKQIAEALGLSATNERNRVKAMFDDGRHFKRTGQGVSTKYFLK